jgi:hypothetical protein
LNGPEATTPMAWAWNADERDEVERRLARLIGRRIEGIRYVELGGYEGPLAPTWPGPIFDSVDYGLELDLHDGATWSFIWKMLDINLGLLAYRGTLSTNQIDPDAAIAVWDVSDHWRARGPEDIAAVASVWTRHAVGPGFLMATGDQVAGVRESAMCLTTVILTSRDGREAVVTLGDRGAGGTYGFNPTNLAIFFSDAEARAAGVLMPGNAYAV